MKKIRVVLVLMMITLAILTGILIFLSKKPTGNVVQDAYSYTKAMCNETNYCADYEIVCENEELSRISPTGAAIQQSESWVDPRGENASEILC